MVNLHRSSSNQEDTTSNSFLLLFCSSSFIYPCPFQVPAVVPRHRAIKSVHPYRKERDRNKNNRKHSNRSIHKGQYQNKHTPPPSLSTIPTPHNIFTKPPSPSTPHHPSN